ncbi:MAG TPA: methylenetetrahydrofolate reductase [Bauldia sp.]|nr:methylenetetrahydrofolate reductase [Bauldia sp.]
MSTVPAAADDRSAVARRLVEWLRGASIEIAAGRPHAVEAARENFDPGTEIFVNFLPGGEPDPVIATAIALRRAGFHPVPHIAARSMPSAAALEDFLARAAGEAGVERVLLIAGDRAAARGPFASSAEVLAGGAIARSGIRSVGFAGHPEGSRGASAELLLPLLAGKIAAARSAGLAPFVVSQFAFEAAPVTAWLDALRRSGIDAPVRIGIAGPATLATLVRFAVACGVGNSLRALRNRPNLVGRLLGVSTPNELLRELAVALAGSAHRATGLHFFPFGGVERTGTWLSETLMQLYVEAGSNP